MKEQDKKALFISAMLFAGTFYFIHGIDPIAQAFWGSVGLFSTGVAFGLYDTAPRSHAHRLIVPIALISLGWFLYLKQVDPYAHAMPDDWNSRNLPGLIFVPMVSLIGLLAASLFRRRTG